MRGQPKERTNKPYKCRKCGGVEFRMIGIKRSFRGCAVCKPKHPGPVHGPYRARGRPSLGGKAKVLFGFRLHPSYRDALEKASLISGISMTSILERALSEHLGVWPYGELSNS